MIHNPTVIGLLKAKGILPQDSQPQSMPPTGGAPEGAMPGMAEAAPTNAPVGAPIS